MTVTFQLTYQEAIDFYVRNYNSSSQRKSRWKENLFYPGVSFALTLLCVIGYFLVEGERSRHFYLTAEWSFIIGIFFLIYFLFLQKYFWKKRTRKNLASNSWASLYLQRQLSLKKECIKLETEEFGSWWEWRYVTIILEDNVYISIHYQNNGYTIIPKRALTEEQLQEMRSFFTEHVQNKFVDARH